MDAYALLGVARTASTDQIRNAYRERAMVHHPDRGGDASTWSDMQRAYDTLCDPQRRAMYDRSQPTNGSAESHFAHAFVDGEAPRKGMNIVEQMEAARQEESKSGERGALAQSGYQMSHSSGFEAWMRNNKGLGQSAHSPRGIRAWPSQEPDSLKSPSASLSPSPSPSPSPSLSPHARPRTGKTGFYTADDLLRSKRGGIEATDDTATFLPPLSTTAVCYDRHGPPEDTY